MARRIVLRGFAIAGAWLSLGMVLSAAACDPPSPMDTPRMERLEHWNPERQQQQAASRANFPSGEGFDFEEGRVFETGRTDCPGNACDKKKDDEISTP